ncbi:MAG: MalY/PatB family protein [Gaiellales bacterium]
MTDWDGADLATLRQRASIKWRTFGSQVIPAFIAEMDYPLARPIATALSAAVAASDTGYSQPRHGIGEAYAGFAAERHEWNVEPGAVYPVPDVMVGVIELLRRAVTPGAGVVITPPVYPPFFEAIAEAGCRVVEAPLAMSPTGYRLDLERMAAAFREAEALLLCNPHNPSGRVFSRPELLQVADLAERHDVAVLSDEIHAPLVMAGAAHTPFLTLDHPIVERTAVLTSASKGWNIPGLKCALVITAPGPMRRTIEEMPREVRLRCGHFGVIATIAAYRDGGPWLDELLGVLDRNRRVIADRLAEHLPDVGYVIPEATFLAWLDMRPAGLGDEPAREILRHGRVAVGRGLDFGEPGRGFVRITFATPLPVLERVLDAVRETVAADRAGTEVSGRPR